MRSWDYEMRYPTHNMGRAAEIVRLLINGEAPSVDSDAHWRGAGESIDFAELDLVVETLHAKLREHGEDPALTDDKEPFEGEVAVAIFAFLNVLPIAALDDPGFWRYLAVSRFWWFIRWRESVSIMNGNVATYTDGRRNTEHIPLRMYLRVKAVAECGDKSLAASLKQCTDFWRSHVIRVRTCTAPPLASEFVKLQLGPERMSTGPLREYARSLNRLWTTVQLGLYDGPKAEAVINELRRSVSK